MFEGNKLEERVGSNFFETFVHEGTQELLQFQRIFRCLFFTIYEMVQYNAPVLCLFLLVLLQTRK